jgi:hypothetical protein
MKRFFSAGYAFCLISVPFVLFLTLMNYYKLLFLTVFTSFSLLSCEKEPLVYRERILDLPLPSRTAPSPVVFVEDHNVYTILSDSTGWRKLTTSGDAYGEISICYNRSRVAYLNQQGSPVIIDMQGKVIGKFPEFTHVRNLGWMGNHETIYFIHDNRLVQAGPPVTLPELDFENIANPLDLVSVAIAPANNTVACIFRIEGDFFGNIMDVYHPDGTLERTRVDLAQDLKISVSGDSLFYREDAQAGVMLLRSNSPQQLFTTAGGYSCKMDGTEYLYTAEMEGKKFLEIQQTTYFQGEQTFRFKLKEIEDAQNFFFDWK